MTSRRHVLVVVVEQIGFSVRLFVLAVLRVIGIFFALMPNPQAVKDKGSQLAIDWLDLLAAAAAWQTTVRVDEALSARPTHDCFARWTLMQLRPDESLADDACQHFVDHILAIAARRSTGYHVGCDGRKRRALRVLD